MPSQCELRRLGGKADIGERLAHEHRSGHGKGPGQETSLFESGSSKRHGVSELVLEEPRAWGMASWKMVSPLGGKIRLRPRRSAPVVNFEGSSADQPHPLICVARQDFERVHHVSSERDFSLRELQPDRATARALETAALKYGKSYTGPRRWATGPRKYRAIATPSYPRVLSRCCRSNAACQKPK